MCEIISEIISSSPYQFSIWSSLADNVTEADPTQYYMEPQKTTLLSSEVHHSCQLSHIRRESQDFESCFCSPAFRWKSPTFSISNKSKLKFTKLSPLLPQKLCNQCNVCSTQVPWHFISLLAMMQL